MKTYRAPGVYVVEDQSTPMPLSGVPTGVPCFFGFTHQGPSYEPTRITSLNEFTAIFGGKPKNKTVFPNAYMLDSVYAFFLNGGGECYVCRVNNGVRASWSVESVEDVVDFKRLEDPFDPSSPDDPDPALIQLKVEAISGGSWANGLRVRLRKTPAQPPRPNIATEVELAVPTSDEYKNVALDSLKPIGEFQVPLGRGPVGRQDQHRRHRRHLRRRAGHLRDDRCCHRVR